jgi:hypothetical protein
MFVNNERGIDTFHNLFLFLDVYILFQPGCCRIGQPPFFSTLQRSVFGTVREMAIQPDNLAILPDYTKTSIFIPERDRYRKEAGAGTPIYI